MDKKDAERNAYVADQYAFFSLTQHACNAVKDMFDEADTLEDLVDLAEALHAFMQGYAENKKKREEEAMQLTLPAAGRTLEGFHPRRMADNRWVEGLDSDRISDRIPRSKLSLSLSPYQIPGPTAKTRLPPYPIPGPTARMGSYSAKSMTPMKGIVGGGFLSSFFKDPRVLQQIKDEGRNVLLLRLGECVKRFRRPTAESATNADDEDSILGMLIQVIDAEIFKTIASAVADHLETVIPYLDEIKAEIYAVRKFYKGSIDRRAAIKRLIIRLLACGLHSACRLAGRLAPLASLICTPFAIGSAIINRQLHDSTYKAKARAKMGMHIQRSSALSRPWAEMLVNESELTKKLEELKDSLEGDVGTRQECMRIILWTLMAEMTKSHFERQDILDYLKMKGFFEKNEDIMRMMERKGIIELTDESKSNEHLLMDALIFIKQTLITAVETEQCTTYGYGTLQEYLIVIEDLLRDVQARVSLIAEQAESNARMKNGTLLPMQGFTEYDNRLYAPHNVVAHITRQPQMKHANAPQPQSRRGGNMTSKKKSTMKRRRRSVAQRKKRTT